MTLILDWPPEVVARLTAEADKAGLSIDEYLLRSVSRQEAPAVPAPTSAPATVAPATPALVSASADSPQADEEAKRKRREEAGRRIVELSKGKSLGPDLTIRDLIEDGRRF